MASDSVITTLHHVEETTRDPSSCTFDKAACNGDFESNHVSPQSPSCPTDSDHINEPLFCDEESESEIFERTDSSSGNSSSDNSEFDSEKEDEEDLEMDEEKNQR